MIEETSIREKKYSRNSKVYLILYTFSWGTYVLHLSPIGAHMSGT